MFIEIQFTLQRVANLFQTVGVILQCPNECRKWAVPYADSLLLISSLDRLKFGYDGVNERLALFGGRRFV
ncbi:hypothetical protein ACFQS5_26490 [Salinirubellus sp. GCM10025899]|uniref:hypothetical protein n=1 Tax=Salinirubellus sp. GCM10025899 TaxID=3252689 RepID=UPI00360A201B